jgi:Cell division protein CrgA
MAKRVKPTKPGARGGGRVTPKASSRYTPPVPRDQKVSPRIVPILMFTLLGLGMVTILLNYVGLLPGGEAKNGYLIIGLVLITGGFITATQYH